MNQQPFQDKAEKLNELNVFLPCLPKCNKNKGAGMTTKGSGGTVLVEVLALRQLAEAAMYTIKCVCFLLGYLQVSSLLELCSSHALHYSFLQYLSLLHGLWQQVMASCTRCP